MGMVYFNGSIKDFLGFSDLLFHLFRLNIDDKITEHIIQGFRAKPRTAKNLRQGEKLFSRRINENIDHRFSKVFSGGP